MNRKGESFSSWTEGILFSLMFMILFGVVIAGMNGLYSKDKDVTGGLGQDSEALVEDFKTLESSLEDKIDDSNALEGGDSGLTISTLWSLIKITWRTTGSFLTGGWIESVVSSAQLPNILAVILRILYMLSIGFIIIKIFSKVRP